MSSNTKSTETNTSQTLVGRSALPTAQVSGDDHVVNAVNAAFCRLLGRTESELIGRPFADLVPEGHECLAMVKDVYRTGEARSHVTVREEKLDPVYWSYTCLPVKGTSPRPLGVVVQVTETALFQTSEAEINQALLISSIDQHALAAHAQQINAELQAEISEHAVAEELLRKNRDIFFGLIEKAPFGLYVVDSQFRLQHVSSGAEHVFRHVVPHIGRDFAEVLGLVWGEPFVSNAIAHFRHTLRTGEPYAEKELTEQRRDVDSVESYDWRIERITLPDGKFGVVCYFYDISEQMKAQALLHEADRRKSEFLATLAHELRNPLAPLRNGLELLALSQGDPSTWDQAHAMMKRQLDQMVRLIDELLDLSRITRGTVDLQLVQVDLRAVIDQAVEISRHTIEQHGHTLVLDLSPSPLIVNGDSMRLAQVFNNLLNNAAKYTDHGGIITIKAIGGAEETSISVTDNGIGITTADQGRVFDMFAQVERAHDRSQGGLGIGLNIVKHLVEQHGGRIMVRSDGPGTGSCFTVILPLIAATVTEPIANTPSLVSQMAAHKRILVVDDNEDAATMMALLLKKWGHTVEVAHDGLEALSTGARFLPELILMDIGMPVMDGHEACTQMRGTSWGRAAYIVALTGWGQQEDKLRSEQAGFDHHLVKPVSRDVLKAVTNTAIASKVSK
jgi:signal transduction histidine kinase/ActR/RegA family two-component response regulator